jgi:PAS domain-containing protein
VDDLACPIVEVTPSGRLRFANGAAAELLGLEAHDLDGTLLDRLGVSLAEQLRIGRRLALLTAERAPAIHILL